jgi:hypothetical protein
MTRPTTLFLSLLICMSNNLPATAAPAAAKQAAKGA